MTSPEPEPEPADERRSISRRSKLLWTIPVVFIVLSAASAILLRRYFAGCVCRSPSVMLGKTVIITGANSGIGKETAMDIAGRGARVIMACRNVEEGGKAAAEIKQATGNNDVVVKELDLASLASVRKFANEIEKSETHLDVLLNNAGVMACPQMKTADGFEMQLGTNHLGHFLLTNLLLDLLKSSAPSRIISVASSAYKRGSINFDDLMLKKAYDPFTAYRQSKLANILFTRKLAKELEGTKVTVNSLHPGSVKTNLWRHIISNDTTWWKVKKLVLYPFYQIVYKTPKEGAQTSICLSVSEEIEGVTGKYFVNCEEEELQQHAMDDEVGEKLWKISEQLVEPDSEED